MKIKIYLSIIAGFLFIPLSKSQVTYELDTSGFEFMRLPDSTVLLKANNTLRTMLNTRIQSSDTSGYVILRAQENSSIDLFDKGGNNNVYISSKFNDSGGAIVLSDVENNKQDVIRLVTNFANSGDARVITDELQINGGSDVAELFDVNEADEDIKPGLLVSLDAGSPGKLKLSHEEYDPLVAGVLSGANGIKPGILMGQDESIATGEELVTITGRAYVMANTSNGAIKVGDLLTSSSIAGQAMKATKKKKMSGTIIGKAMTPLSGDSSGYVLVLIHLQ